MRDAVFTVSPEYHMQFLVTHDTCNQATWVDPYPDAKSGFVLVLLLFVFALPTPRYPVLRIARWA